MRTSHTTTSQKAKCLKYRNGQRCGRVGTILVSFQDHQGWHSYPVCKECATDIVAGGGEAVEASPRGYHVITGQFAATREYRRIR
jgi:hypothetical protein